MKVTCDTKGIQMMNKGGKLASASITLDDAFVVRNLSVMTGANGIFVSMPSQRGVDKNGREAFYDTAFPLSKELRHEISKVVLDAYTEKLRELAQQAAQNRSDMSDEEYDRQYDAHYANEPDDNEFGGY